MDNSLKDLEAELAELTPAAPSTRLEQRLAADLGTNPSAMETRLTRRSAYRSATTWTSWKWANWTVAAALVVMMTMATRWAPTSEAPSALAVPGLAQAGADSADILRPVRAARTLIESRPEAIVELPDGSPVERVRDYFVDTIEWRDAAGETQLRWELPRESVRFVALASY